MSKELEALEEIRDFRYGEDKLLVCQTEMYSTIKKALQHLESIDKSKSSEALECLEDIYRNGIFISDYDALGKQHPTNISPETNKSISEQCNTINKALIKAQEQEMVLEIIKNKCLTNCNLALVKNNVHYELYCWEFEYFLNKYNESHKGFEITKEDLLTQEEFELLKRWLG